MTKQSTLGRVFISITFYLLTLNVSLLASLSATVDKPSFYQGDEVTLEIKASGENIQFSEPKTIGGFKLNSSGISDAFEIIDGKTVKQKSATYRFNPNVSMTIPQMSVKIDGKNYTTSPIKITKIEPTVSKPNDDFALLFETSKKKVYVGEAIVVAIVFKHKADLEVLDAKLTPFESDGFLIKPLENSPKFEKNGYVFYQNNFIIFPQKSGKFTIQNQLINVATRERKTNFMLWKRVFSGLTNIEVLPLPNKISLHGDFNITATVDKSTKSSNTPINLTIKISGFGNINDIGEFPLELPNAVAYSTKPQTKTFLKGGKYGGDFVQKISIISENDFIIPAFTMQYFDTTKNIVKKISTTPIEIKIKGSDKETPKVETKDGVTGANQNQSGSQNSDFTTYLFGLIGFIFGFLVAYLFVKKSKWKKADTPLIKQIKIAPNDKELYNILLPYANKEGLKTHMKLLEENIYKNAKGKIDKKAIIELFEDEIL